MDKIVIVFEGTEQQYYMDGFLKDNLDTAKKVIKEDWDMVFLVDGYEGTGKSVFAQQVAYYSNPLFTLANIVFTPNSFREAIINASKYHSILYDEAYGGLSSRGSMSQVNRIIVKMLTEIRQKNLFIIIVLPTIFDLDRYVAIWRSRALMHIYSGDGFKRGFFAFYNADKKKQLYMLGKKFYSYSKPEPNFTGRFTNHYTVDQAAYREKKYKSTVQEEESEDKRVMMATITRKINAKIAQGLMNSELNLSQKQISEILLVSTRTIHNYNNKYTE